MIITSLAPSHKNSEAQMRAVESWKRLGQRIISVNHKSEIEQLYKYDVEFHIPEKTGIETFGRHYVPVSEILKLIKKEGAALVLNSDIILTGLPNFEEKAYIFNRYDFDADLTKASLFRSGFDGFYLTPEMCDLPETKLCLGQCHWDYWLPVMLLQKGVKLHRPVKPYLMHQKHPLQYSNDAWKRSGEIFMRETGMRGSVQSVSSKAFSLIHSKIQNII